MKRREDILIDKVEICKHITLCQICGNPVGVLLFRTRGGATLCHGCAELIERTVAYHAERAIYFQNRDERKYRTELEMLKICGIEVLI